MKNGGGSKADEAMQGEEITKNHLMMMIVMMIMMRAMKQLMRLVKKMMSLMRKMTWEE